MNKKNVDPVMIANCYESVVDGRNEYDYLLPLVRVQPDKTNNFDEIFLKILNKKSITDAGKLTQDDLHKLDSFGTALAWFVPTFCIPDV